MAQWDDNNDVWNQYPETVDPATAPGNNGTPGDTRAPTDPWTDPSKPPDWPLGPGMKWVLHPDDGRWWQEADPAQTPNPNANKPPSLPPASGWQQPPTGGPGTGGLTPPPASLYEAPAPFDYPDFTPTPVNAPPWKSLGTFSYPDYKPMSGDEVLKQDPGYDFREKAGLRAITNQKSAEGILKTGGTLKGMADWVSGLASQEYGNADARNFRNWQTGYTSAADTFDRNARSQLADYSVPYGAATDQFAREASTYGTNLGKAEAGHGFGLDVAAGKAGGLQGAGSLGLGQGQLQLGRDTLTSNNANNWFGNLLALYQATTRNLPTYQPSV